MSVFPQLQGGSSSTESGVAGQIKDLARRVKNLEGARTVITTVSGSVITWAPGTIPGNAIVTGSLTAAQIQAGSITTASLAAGSVTTSILAAGAVTAITIAADSINSSHIVAGTIQASDIQTHTITALQIAAGTITATEIAAGTITAGNIVSHTITALQIAAGTITATEITAGTITAGLIAAGTITATQIAAGTITSTLMAANSVTSTAIVSGAVTAAKINVSQLSAISADMGSISAGVVSGATLQTSASGARVVMDTGGITGFDAASVAKFAFSTSTGNLTLTGVVTASAGSVVPTTVLSGTINGGTQITTNTIPGGALLADSINTRELAASSVTTVEILANTITAGDIAAGTITATQIAAGTITATQLSATAIDTMTLTGTTIQTSSNINKNKVILDSSGLRAYGDTLPAPTTVSATHAAQVGATLPAGTYYYVVTALNSQGETVKSAEVSVTTTGGTDSAIVWFDPVTTASSYHIYRGTAAGAENLLVSGTPVISGAQLAFVDFGQSTSAGAPPATNTAYTLVLNVTTTGVGTLTGPVIRTSELNPKVQLDSTGLFATDLAGADIFRLNSDGSGLVLAAGTGDKNAIAWFEPGGMSMATIWASGTTNATAKLNVTTKKVNISSGSAPPAGSKMMTSLVTILDADGTTLSMGPGATGYTRTILNTSDQSSFLQLTSVAKKTINMGTVTTGSFGNTNKVTGGTFTHGLGATPSVVILHCQTIAVFGSSGPTTSPITVSMSASSSTTVTFDARIDDGLSNNASTVHWIAIL